MTVLRRPYEELHAENQRLRAIRWAYDDIQAAVRRFVDENRGNPDFENLAYSDKLKNIADGDAA